MDNAGAWYVYTEGENKLEAWARAQKDGLKLASAFVASDIGGRGVLQNLGLCITELTQHAHLAQKLKNLKEDVGEAGAVTEHHRKDVSQQLATMHMSYKAAAASLLHSQSP